MPRPASDRITTFINALPLRPNLRVLEIGCGPGVAARLVAQRLGQGGFILAIDRSVTAIARAIAGSTSALQTGRLKFRRVAIEDFVLEKEEQSFDLAFAMRVGALDGRHPELEQCALARLRNALTPTARLFIDGGDPLREIPLH